MGCHQHRAFVGMMSFLPLVLCWQSVGLRCLEDLKQENGVADGARTHDNRNHNPGLYQLSYSHRRATHYSARLVTCRQGAEAAAAGALTVTL